jgi:hypothetical protein
VRFRNGGALYRESESTENGGHLFAVTGNVNDRVQTMAIPYSALNNQRWAGVRTLVSNDGVDVTGIKYLETWIYGDGKDNKWLVFDFGTISEDSSGDLPYGGSRLLIPGHNPSSSSITCGWPDQGVDEEGNPANPGGCDTGIRTYYMPGLNFGAVDSNGNTASLSIPQPITGFSDENPSPEGLRNNVFDTKDLNGNGYIDTTNQYLSYGVRANWTGWKLVKIPIDPAAPEGMFTTSDGLSCFFHNQGGFGTGTGSPIVHAMRLWMTGTNPTDVGGDGDILMESIRLTGIATSGQILSHGLGVVLAPVPAHRGGDICLYPDERISGSKWEVYNVMGVSVKSLTFNSPYGNCWNTSGVAPGVYFVLLNLSYADGKETKAWKKVVVTP